MIKQQLKILVCGGRNFDQKESLFKELDEIKNKYDIILLIQGGASGADSFAKEWARINKIPYKTYYADWKTYGKAAGIIRNKRMLVEGNPDLVVAFRGGNGTLNMVSISEEIGKKVLKYF